MKRRDSAAIHNAWLLINQRGIESVSTVYTQTVPEENQKRTNSLSRRDASVLEQRISKSKVKRNGNKQWIKRL